MPTSPKEVFATDASSSRCTSGNLKPVEQPRPPGQPSVDRRKVLFGLGFGAANAALLRQLGTGSGETVIASGGAGTSAEGGDRVATTLGPPVVTDPPSLTDETPPADTHVYDRVISGGRVIDPESGFDAIADVGIDGKTITAISLAPLQSSGARIDATGMVVAPGFIDILSYNPNGYGEWFKIQDGVTTNLCMHGVDVSGESFFRQVEQLGGSPVHYGGASDNDKVRNTIAGLGVFDEPTAGQIGEVVRGARADIEAGLIGIHMQPEYAPGATESEVLAHAELAREFGVPLCVHARYSDDLEPGTQAEAMNEVVRVAEATGVRLHVEHINSTGGTGRMTEALATLEAGRNSGLDLSACIYPYRFWATYLRSPRYDNWQEKYGIDYGQLQVAGSSERLNASTFPAAFEENKLTAAFTMTEEDIATALRSPWVMVGSDAILEPAHNNHPRSTGCFSRIVGKYVRDLQVIDLRSGLAKLTILPAKLVEVGAPAMRRKGRMQMGADADIAIFDPTTIIDRSTIAKPQRPSEGMKWVLVDGTVVLSPEGLDRDVRPGTPIRSAV